MNGRGSVANEWKQFTMNNVYVAGSINMDVVATAARYPKMGETVPGREIFFFPGGKGANQAVSAAKLGARAILIGCLGEDAFGRELATFLSSQGIDLTNVRYSNRPCGNCIRAPFFGNSPRARACLAHFRWKTRLSRRQRRPDRPVARFWDHPRRFDAALTPEPPPSGLQRRRC